MLKKTVRTRTSNRREISKTIVHLSLVCVPRRTEESYQNGQANKYPNTELPDPNPNEINDGDASYATPQVMARGLGIISTNTPCPSLLEAPLISKHTHAWTVLAKAGPLTRKGTCSLRLLAVERNPVRSATDVQVREWNANHYHSVSDRLTTSCATSSHTWIMFRLRRNLVGSVALFRGSFMPMTR